MYEQQTPSLQKKKVAPFPVLLFRVFRICVLRGATATAGAVGERSWGWGWVGYQIGLLVRVAK